VKGLDEVLKNSLMITIGVLISIFNITLFDNKTFMLMFEHPIMSMIPFIWHGVVSPLVWILLGMFFILMGIRKWNDELFFIMLSLTIIIQGIGHLPHSI
jgi:hypothetical protein